MAINIQNLASITDISQLKVGADNQLQQRSGIGTFFLKIGDAFRNLSQAGRASIAQRNDSILNAMRAAVDNARETVRAEDRPMAQRLSAVFQRLQTASTNRATLSGLETAITRLQTQASAAKHGIANDPRFTAMSPHAQQGLCYALDSISAANKPGKEAAMERVKNDFFGIRPETFNMEAGLQLFSDDLVEDFLRPIQQAKVKENGIHESFILDTRRRAIDSFNGVPVPQSTDEASKDVIAGYCVQQLDTLLGAEHQDLKPFISMMASQAGLDSAQSFLPVMSGLSDPADAHLTNAQIMPNNSNSRHHTSITREGDTLHIVSSFDLSYKMYDSLEGPTVLHCKGSVTMSIDLSAAPRREMADGKEVLIPQFTLNNGDVRFETPAAD